MGMQRWHEQAFVLPLCLLMACAYLTHRRLPVWRSDLPLWRDAASKTPIKPRPVMDYGRALEMSGDMDGAMEQFRRTISLTFDERRGHKSNRFALAAAETNIAHIYLRTGQQATALKVLEGTLAWWPDFPYAHYNIGRLLWEHGHCEEGLDEIAFARRYDNTLSLPVEPCGPLSP